MHTTTATMPANPRFHRRERGTALVTGLVFLVILTLLGLSASSNAIQQEIIARNIRDQNMAMQAAEAALRTAEIWIRQNGGPEASNMVNGNAAVHDSRTTPFCSGTATCEYAGGSWWSANAITVGTDVTTPLYNSNTGGNPISVKTQPAYVIELLTISPPGLTIGTTSPRTKVYKITARGVGISDNTVRILASYYRYG